MLEIDASTPCLEPPVWALRQRSLFDLLADAIDPFVEHYFDEDGEPYWPPEGHVGIDGFDDIVEGFHNWPLVYAMGGDERLLTDARKCYRAALRRGRATQTPFGHPMIVDDFEQCRDWFHLGEGNRFTYNMGLAAPEDPGVVDRAERFAGLYLPGAGANNYDAQHRLIRGPMSGSMGPEFCDFGAYEHHPYGAGYRWGLHGLPWKDVPDVDSITDASDSENEATLLEAMGERCSTGDVPLNLAATSLLTNAYLHTGDERYREWVLDYADAWNERAADNGGLVPDNVSRDGEIGGVTGDWYGGYYGWSWGGWHYVGVGVTVGSENATLLSGDGTYMDLLRTHLDELVDNAIAVSDDPVHETLYLPHKYGDPGDHHYDPGSALREPDGEVYYEDGWFEFRPHRDDPYAVHLWYHTMDEADRDRVRSLRDWGARDWTRVDPRPKTKHGGGHEYAWLAYLDGSFEGYPERLLEAAIAQVQQRLDVIHAEGGPPDSVDEDYLRDRNPVTATALLQLTLGAPQPVYYGGLVHAQVRHFDAERERPGLPPGVAALVEDVDNEGIELTLVNTGGSERRVVVQAGAYGEHEFASVAVDDGIDQPGANAVEVALPAASLVEIDADLDRFVDDPSYDLPLG